MLIVIILALWLTIHKRRNRPKIEYQIEDYRPPDRFYMECLPQAEPKPDDSILDFERAEMERLQALRQEYMEVLDAVEREQQALKREYDGASVKRQSTIATRLTTLASKRATTTRTLSSIDSKIEKQYYKIND